MVRAPWDEKAGDARGVIEPLVREVLHSTDLEINTGEDLGLTTAEVIVRRRGREARCIVTFEAWEQAREHPEKLREALQRVAGDLGGAAALPAYLLTSRGLDTAPAEKDRHTLAAMAHGIEADVLVERFFKRKRRR